MLTPCLAKTPSAGSVRSRIAHRVALLCLLAAAGSSHAGSLVWSQDKISPPLNYRDDPVAVPYRAPGSGEAGQPAGQSIVSVHASISYAGSTALRTLLCWNSLAHCVPVTGNATTTNAFNGLDPFKPMLLVHEVPGKGPLPTPLYVKGRVAVWYGP